MRTLVERWNELGPGARLGILAQVGLLVAEQAEALASMELIRERWVKRGAEGEVQ